MHTFALNLGDEIVYSLLGEPVNLDLEVRDWDEIALENIRISIASQSNYNAFNLQYLPILDELEFTLSEPDSDGRVKLNITSEQALNEPYLELLLVLRWPGGSLMREYSLLFDPPGSPYALTRAQEQNQSTAGLSALPEQPEPSLEPEPQEASLQVDEPTAQTTPDERYAEVINQLAIEVEQLNPASNYGTVNRTFSDSSRRRYSVQTGDSLWSIALQFRPAQRQDNLFQMMLGIHNLNRNAFINGNISLLKTNEEILIPNRADLENINNNSAERIFNERWQQGTRRFEISEEAEAIPLFATLPTNAVDEPAQEEEISQSEASTEAGLESTVINPSLNSGLIVASSSSVIPFQEPVEPSLPQSAFSDAELTEASALDPDEVIADQAPNGIVTDEPEQALLLTGLANQDEFQESGNPYLDRINRSAMNIQALMRARQSQLASLELQVTQMRVRLQQAQTATASVNASLQLALENRARQEEARKQMNFIIAGVVLALSLALIATLVLSLNLSGKLKTQKALYSHSQRKAKRQTRIR